VVETLAALGRVAEFAVTVIPPDAILEELATITFTERTSVVVATHGNVDEDALEQVLGSQAGYVSLVASRTRAAAVVESLKRRGVPPEGLGRLKAPAGLDVGAVSPEEIAVSILAEIIQNRRGQKTGSTETDARSTSLAPPESTDPVCGMRVETATTPYRSEASGQTVYFCCRRCMETFDRAPGKYARI